MIVTGPTRSATAFCRATCQPGDAVGDFVRIASPVVGSVYAVTKADPSDAHKMPAIGTVIKKFSSTTCLVQRSGLAAWTGVPSFTTGRLVFVGLDARPTVTPPSAGSSISGFAVVQVVGVAADVDKVDLEVSPILIKTRV